MNQQTPTLEQIKKRIARELNISHLAQNEQDEIITQMSTLLLDRVTMAILSELPTEETSRVDQLLDANQSETVRMILEKQVPNAAQIAEVIIAETLGEYQAVIAKASAHSVK